MPEKLMKKTIITAISLTLFLFLLTGCKPKTPVPTEASTEEATTAEVSEAPTSESKTTETTPVIVESKLETFKENNISIEYPILTGIEDAGLKDSINGFIKDCALSVTEREDFDALKDTAVVKASIHSLSKQKLVLLFNGSITKDGETKATAVEYSLTLDLTTGKPVRLTNYISAAALGAMLASGEDYAIVTDNAANQTKIKEYLMNMPLEEIEAILEQADFSADNPSVFPQSTSYDMNGTIIFIYPVPEELGGYVTLSFTPDNK